MQDFISTTQAAKILGVNRQRVVFFIRSGRLPALKVSRDYIIERKHAENFIKLGPLGKPLDEVNFSSDKARREFTRINKKRK